MNFETAWLVEGLRRRDPEACAKLVEAYQVRLFTFFVRRTGDAHAAEDLFQDTCLKILNSMETYHHEGRFEAWVFTIAHRLVVDWTRRTSRREQALNPEFASYSGSEAAGESEAMRVMTSQELAQWVMELPGDQRDVVCLHYYGELTMREISRVLNVPLGTALSRMHRALIRLRLVSGERGRA